MRRPTMAVTALLGLSMLLGGCGECPSPRARADSGAPPPAEVDGAPGVDGGGPRGDAGPPSGDAQRAPDAEVDQGPPCAADPALCAPESVRCVDDDPGPFQEYTSIQDAVDAAQPGDTVYVKAGRYRESVTLTRSGTAQLPIVIAAFPCDEGRAEIDGAQPITSWRKATPAEVDGNPLAGQIYVAEGIDFEVLQLFADGERLVPARFPQPGGDKFVDIAWVDPGKPRQVFVAAPLKGLPDGFLAGSRAHVKNSHYTIYGRRVASSAAGKVTLAEAVSWYDIKVGYGAFFTQVPGAIDADGRWAYRDGKLFLFATSPPSGISAARRPCGVCVAAAAAHVEVRHLAIRRFAGSCVDVAKNKGQDLAFVDNDVAHCSEYGISYSGGAGARIERNSIDRCWAAGISVASSDAPLVQRNVITRTGTDELDGDVLYAGGYAWGAGLRVISSPGGVFRYNRIDSSAYSGVVVSNFTDVGGRTVAYNHVSNACLGLNDGAGIYFHAEKDSLQRSDPAAWDTIEHNIVRDCRGSWLGTAKWHHSQAFGIYIDIYKSRFVRIRENTVINTAGNIFLHNAREIEIEGNTLYGSPRKQLLATHDRDCSASAPAGRNIVLRGNTLYSTDPAAYTLQLRKSHVSCPIFGEAADNRFYGAGRDQHILRQILSPSYSSGTYDVAGWRAASGLEQGSAEVAGGAPSRILFNDSEQHMACSGLVGCHDLEGQPLSALTIAPFRSVILVGCTANPSCQ